MHLILMTRGIQQSRDIWKQFMASQMYKFPQKNLDWCQCGTHKDLHGTDKCVCPEFKPREEPKMVQGALRPIELWEYVFPRESLQEVLAMQNTHKEYNRLRPEVNKMGWLLRKAMGAKKIPDMPDLQNKEMWEITSKFVPMSGMAVYPIGIKEDNYAPIDFGQHGKFEQEWL